MCESSDKKAAATERLSEIVTDDSILWGVVANARPRRRGPRWVGVMERTGMGSTASALLCRRFGFDPDEAVK